MCFRAPTEDPDEPYSIPALLLRAICHAFRLRIIFLGRIPKWLHGHSIAKGMVRAILREGYRVRRGDLFKGISTQRMVRNHGPDHRGECPSRVRRASRPLFRNEPPQVSWYDLPHRLEHLQQLPDGQGQSVRALLVVSD